MMLTYIKEKDDKMIAYIHKSYPRNRRLTAVAKLINTIGNGGLMWLCLALILILIGQKSFGYMIIFGDLFYFLICHQLIKKTIIRKRPFQDNPEIQLEIAPPSSSSFPSGHVTISFASTTILFFLNPLAGLLALLISLIVAFSRLYLLVHYPSDILAGMIIGIADGLIAVYLVTFLMQF